MNELWWCTKQKLKLANLNKNRGNALMNYGGAWSKNLNLLTLIKEKGVVCEWTVVVHEAKT